MDIDWLELLKDLWLFYSIGKEIYTQWSARQVSAGNCVKPNNSRSGAHCP